MTPIILESPYAGEVARNMEYLQRCIRHSMLEHNEAPFASHLMYTSALDDRSSQERLTGISAGYAWWPLAEKIVFYIDYGYSEGMQKAMAQAMALNKIIETRMIGRNEIGRNEDASIS